MAGRPSIYTEDLATEICTRLAGGESLRAICRDDAMPAISTVLMWVVDGKHSQFMEQYREAREAQGYFYADSILDVASLVGHGELEPQQAKVIMDAYKWTAERNASKAYGPRKAIEHSSPDGSMTPKQAIDASTLSDTALEELMRARRAEPKQ